MTEGVGGIQDVHPPAQFLGVAGTEEEVAHQGFAQWDQLVGEHIPRTHGEPPPAHERGDAGAPLGTNTEIVLDQDRLTSSRKLR